MIDTLTDNGINIKDLVLEQSTRRSDIPFDPQRDISEQDWKTIIDRRIGEYSDDLRNSGFRAGAGNGDMEFFRAVAFLAPDKIKPLITDDVWNKMKNFKENETLGASASILATMRLVDPERFASEPKLDDREWLMIRNSYLTHPAAAVENRINIASKAKIIDPDKTEDYILRPPIQWDDVQDAIDKRISAGSWFMVAKLLADIKILDPERAKNFHISEETWNSMKKDLDRYRNTSDKNKDISFAQLSSFMTIISAQEIRITDKGVEVVMPKSQNNFGRPNESIPQRRRF